MITRKELGYIHSWPIKTPYPGNDYCIKVLEKLSKCFELYNRRYLNRKYTIQFSNNEEIDFQILESNICHMLGIDHKNLTSKRFDDYKDTILGIKPGKFISSYDLLSHIIKSSEEVLEYDKKTSSCNSINYYKVGIKCDIFSKLADLSSFNYGCINFDKNIFKVKNPNETFSPNSTKFLYTPSDEIVSPYFLMGLKLDSKSSDGDYIVETLMARENPVSLFDGQEVVIPTQILTDDNGILGKKIATSEEKIRLLKEYSNLVNLYGIASNINIYGDYFSILMSEREKKLVLK